VLGAFFLYFVSQVLIYANVSGYFQDAIAGAIVVCALLQAVLYRSFVLGTGRIGQDILLELRQRVFAHFQRLSLAFHERYTSGRMISRLTSDMDTISAMLDAGLDTLDYLVQAMTSSIANHGESLAPLMRRAGFRYVFLGIENILEDDLEFLRAASKNEERRDGHVVGNATLRAVEHLRRNKMYVVGGLIVGNPDDTRESIETNLEFARRHVDWPYIQHPTPYPGTPMTREFVEGKLVINERLEEYDGTTAVVRSRHLPADEIEFLRWRAERWMKVRHVPAAFRQSPLWVLRHGHRMMAHTFRGSTLRSFFGLEDARAVFERYRAIRNVERDYLREEEAERGPAGSTLGARCAEM